MKCIVKWSGKKYDIDVETQSSEALSQLRAQLFSLTQVPPERQKLLVKGGQLRTESDVGRLLQEGATLTLMGTPDAHALKEPTDADRVRFIEDMTVAEANLAHKIPVGLVNLGNTCYMNATLQCLRAIPELPTTLTTAISGSLGPNPTKNVLVSMRDLFASMQSAGQGVPPLVFLQMLRQLFPQFSQQDRTGSYMQQDAEECWTSLVALLERELPGEFVQKYMTGQMEQHMRCDDAPQEEPTTSIQPFTRLNCHISISVNYLHQGLQASLTEHITKHSPTLNRSAAYTKLSLLSRLPKYLPISFVRFYWKQEQQIKAKIMRAVKFPMALDLAEFCTPQLQQKMKPAREVLMKQENARRDTTKKRKMDTAAAVATADGVESHSQAADVGVDLTGVDTMAQLRQRLDPTLLNDEGCNIHAHYELVAVLTHVGRSADSGHYMAWTKHAPTPTATTSTASTKEKQGEEEVWWKFDDDTVTQVKEDEIVKLAGGGDWHMAYLLVYKAKEIL